MATITLTSGEQVEAIKLGEYLGWQVFAVGPAGSGGVMLCDSEGDQDPVATPQEVRRAVAAAFLSLPPESLPAAAPYGHWSDEFESGAAWDAVRGIVSGDGSVLGDVGGSVLLRANRPGWRSTVVVS